VNLNEMVWISYAGAAGWVQKTVASTDGFGNPTFDPAGDLPYTLELNREYYLNDRGVNYVVSFDGTSTTARVEQQSVANPRNVTGFLQGVSYFKQAWGTGTTYSFDPVTMALVVRTVGTGDTASAGSAVTSSIWGLTGYDAANLPLGVQFNWEYPMDGGGNMGLQQFLVDGSGGLVVLDDPIRMKPELLTDGAGATRTYSLVFDGSWVGGLPEIWSDLQAASFNLTAAIKQKVVTIPSSLAFTDAADATKTYLFKPLEVSQYLMTLSSYAGTLTTDAAAALDLATVPTWQDTAMGPPPTDAVLKYSEGKPVGP
jgi:hypothetical protein